MLDRAEQSEVGRARGVLHLWVELVDVVTFVAEVEQLERTRIDAHYASQTFGGGKGSIV